MENGWESTGKRKRGFETVCEEFCLKTPCKIKPGIPQWAFASIAEIPPKKAVCGSFLLRTVLLQIPMEVTLMILISLAWLGPHQVFFLNYIYHNILGLLISRFTLSKLFFFNPSTKFLKHSNKGPLYKIYTCIMRFACIIIQVLKWVSDFYLKLIMCKLQTIYDFKNFYF